LELGGGLLHYSGGTTSFQDAADANAGAFIDAQLTEHAHIRANGGYTVYSPDASASQLAPSDFTGVYGQLLLVHKVNRFLGYTLSGGRTVNFAFFGGTIDLATVQIQMDWSVVQGVTVGTFFQYDHGSQLFNGTEIFDRYGPGLSLGSHISEKLSGNIRYQYYLRESNLSGGDYAVKLVTLSLGYQL
jgi:hypothetical protein